MANLHASYGPSRVLNGIDFSLAGNRHGAARCQWRRQDDDLRALCAMVRTEGSIRFAGQAIERRATEDIVRLGIAHVPDGRGTFAH